MSATEIIDTLGGTTAVARMLGIKPPSVHEWRANGIPRDKLVRLAAPLEFATGGRYCRWHVCPEDWHRIWPELKKAKGSPPIPAQAEEAGRN